MPNSRWATRAPHTPSSHEGARTPRERLAPHLADVLDVVRVVDVQLGEQRAAFRAGNLGEIHLDALGALMSIQLALAAQDARRGRERAEEGLLVLGDRVLDKGGPVAISL